MSSGVRWLWVGAAGTLILSACVLLAVAMTKPLNHDEQQFIAAGALVGREGLLPYRDFAFFHTPYLPFVYSAVFPFMDHLLLAGRLVSIGLMWLGSLAVFGVAWKVLSLWKNEWRITGATAASLAFLANPLILYSSWKAWNHALPILFFVLAIVCHWLAVTKRRDVLFLLGGIFVSLAAGTRLSYAPLALPFLILAAVSLPGNLRERSWRVLWCGGGMAIGALPAFFLIAQAPQAFFFDNFVYNGSVNTAFRTVAEGRERLGAQKFFFVLRTLVHPASLVLLVMFCWLGWSLRVGGRRWPYLFWSTLVLLPFVLLGTLAPTPSYSQYYSPLVPLLIIGIVGGLAALPVEGQKRNACILATIPAIAVVSSAGYLGSLPALFHPAGWVPVEIHREGMALRKHPLTGPVLTLSPILPLEGGLKIYPQLASGPFGWRTAPYILAKDRERFLIAGVQELPVLAQWQAPGAIYAGYERKHEGALADFARKEGYRKVALGKKKELWISESR